MPGFYARGMTILTHLPSGEVGQGMLNYSECSTCGAACIDESAKTRHMNWHTRVDSDTDVYKQVLDEAKQLADELKGLRARMPRMT